MCVQTEIHRILRARHIAALFNVEKLAHRIPYHFPCFFAKQHNNNCSIGVIPNTTYSQNYTLMTTTTHYIVTGVRLGSRSISMLVMDSFMIHQHSQIMPCNRPTTHLIKQHNNTSLFAGRRDAIGNKHIITMYLRCTSEFQ